MYYNFNCLLYFIFVNGKRVRSALKEVFVKYFN